MINVKMIRDQFPQVSETYTDNKPIYYLDSAATNLTHVNVVKALDTYYLKECANVHRGIHTLSEVSTDKFEHTRSLLHKFFNSAKREEIILTKGTTDSINLVARAWGDENIKEGDEILISHMEHHSNIVPWQMLCERTGAVLKVIPINDAGEIIYEKYLELLNPKTKMVSVVYVSNTLGTINPIAQMIDDAKKFDAVFMVDAAQATAHLAIDVQQLDCDFMALSAHKMFGPTGAGALYGKEKLLNEMPPLFGGGDMIDKVTFEKTTYNTIPHKFEAGTPSIASIIAWAPAIEFINETGLENIAQYEHELLTYATEKLSSIKELTIIGQAAKKTSVISFTLKGIHAHDIATLANQYQIAIRTGHHCTQPLLQRLNVAATARASFSIYNTKEEIDHLYNALIKIINMFS
ncbi:MAG: cysteine desulfurase [Halobacteriovoraceae bacterium]|jgi:cysteine desulfurase / selenocysteine lyase|nr:cysteine desulfurase [Halobacteriovoraceae bacterium]